MKAPPEATTIRSIVGVRQRPTVVQLGHLDAADAAWISDSWFTTPVVERCLEALRQALGQDTGCGAFLVGQYGSGKSHFLAYLAQGLRSGRLLPRAPDVVAVSLLDYRGSVPLEDVVSGALGIEPAAPGETGDRRPRFARALTLYPRGVLLLLDELSEFLRSKPDARTFSEDVRFLQFLGEWAAQHRFWVLGAMQEQIERTGELDYGVWRKIKDRYPLRFQLTPAHVRDLIGQAILVKHAGYEAAAQRVVAEVRAGLPGKGIDEAALAELYPIHPATLDLLEEVRDRFSRARGVVDFVTARLVGDPARHIEPFLDRPLGELIGPEAIIDHFRDVLAIQAEFLPIGQKLLPYYEKHLGQIFDRPATLALARRVLDLLILVWLSPERESATPEEIAVWLLHRTSRLEPSKNVEIVAKVLDRLARDGRFVAESAGRFRLDFADDDAALFEKRLEHERAELAAQGAALLAQIAPLLDGTAAFHPFRLPHGETQHRKISWRFHERRFEVFLGNDVPPPTRGLSICVRLPWGDAGPVPGAWTLLPRPIAVTPHHVDLVALQRLRDRPWSERTRRRLEAQIAEKEKAFAHDLRAAYVEGSLVGPTGAASPLSPVGPQTSFDAWLEAQVEHVLRRLYPSFEQFAPAHGPLAKDVLRRFARGAMAGQLTDEAADDAVQLVREGYLMPMGLLHRQGRGYLLPKSLERHELVRLVLPLLDHQPAPQAVHAHLAQPVYGLVPDQVHVLLILLASLGEIDLVKDGKSYRELCEMLPDTLHYDRVVSGAALPAESVQVLEALCDGLRLQLPKQWTVLAQRRAIERLREVGREAIGALEPILLRLATTPSGKQLAQRVQRAVQEWRTLLGAGGPPLEGEIQSFERFLDRIGPVPEFLRRTSELAGLPEKLDRLLLELGRYRHLLDHPVVAKRVAGVLPPPDLDRLDQVDAWLREAKARYEGYVQGYRQAHDRFWQQRATHPVWSYSPPVVAGSRQLGLDAELAALAASRKRAGELRCRGLAGLEFQPLCTCGFAEDGCDAAKAFEAFDEARRAVDASVAAFFARKDVRRKLQAAAGEGGTDARAIAAYVEGQTAVPAITDVAAFDRALQGVPSVRRIGWREVARALGEQPVDRQGARLLFDRFLEKLEPDVRLRFEAEAEGAPAGLLAWCLEQCLRHGAALPAGMPRGALDQAAAGLDPGWVGPSALARLETLNLPDSVVDRVLASIAGGLSAVADPRAASPLVRAARELVSPTTPRTPSELGALAALLYGADTRLRRTGGERWLARLRDLALSGLSPVPPLLVERLRELAQAQWLIVDCLGLALLPALGDELEARLSAWQRPVIGFARVSTETTTDACYRDLLAAGLVRSFHKVDAIDAVLHETPGASFDELARLAAAALGNGLRRAVPELDPAKPLVVFADHGFRLAADASRFEHGGPSTLERVVPVMEFRPQG